MIRVDNMEQIQELRKKGITSDIIFISRGDDEKPETTAEKPETKEETAEVNETTGTESIDYDKIINGVAEKLTPLIQDKNRKKGFEVADETLDDIMKKFADM